VSRYRVVPVAVERVSGEIYRDKLGIGNFDALRMLVLIKFSAYFETGFGCGRGDQLHNGAECA
jgi:hypothetical protein